MQMSISLNLKYFFLDVLHLACNTARSGILLIAILHANAINLYAKSNWILDETNKYNVTVVNDFTELENWSVKVVNQIIRFNYHTSWVAVVTPTDRPKSERNIWVIELFCGVVCVVTLPFWHFCWCRGFCHRTGSDLFLFLKRTALMADD